MKQLYATCSLVVALWVMVGSAAMAGVRVQGPVQSITVNGRTTDASTGEPLIGVTITLEGSTTATASDVNGRFSIRVPNSGNAALVVSYIGYTTQRIPVNGRTEINVPLASETDVLDEVVVVGYGVQKRSNVTGSISTVKTEALENKSLTRLDQALQGQAAGVTVTQNGGAPGQAPTIHIRGVGSINNTEPLWVVDGIRMGPGNHFNIEDVESIEILKDAASAAIYGAKAAHGVILVTTKRGKGKLQTSFKASVGKRSPIELPELLRGADYAQYKKQAMINAGQTPYAILDNPENPNTDWINEYYGGSGMIQSYDFSLSKGDDNSNIYVSLGYDDEKGLLLENTYKRLSARINSDFNLTKWLKLGESALLSRVTEDPINNFNENYSGGIPYRSLPIMPLRDPNNPFGGWGRGPSFFQGPNPVATQYQQHETRNYNRLDGNLYLEATPLAGLTLRGTVGYGYTGYMGEQFFEAFNYGPFSNPNAALTYSSASDESLTGFFLGTYEKGFGPHNFKVTAGYEATQFETTHFNLTGNGFPVDVARSLNLATGSFNTTDRQNVYMTRTLSQFGRLSYNFNEKYLFEANIRRDASAPAFGPQNIWGVFPSFSAGWNISNEEFFQGVPYITTLKLRASTGTLGSDAIPGFLWLKTYTSQFTSYAFDADGQNKTPGFFISKFPNEEVKWEEVTMHDIGLDLTAFQNKLRFSFDYYIKDTKDLLYSVPIPTSVGIAVHNMYPVNPAVNIGTMRNTGVDLELGYRTTFNRFDINVSGNTSFMKNELLSLGEDGEIIGGGAGVIGGMTITRAGLPVSSFYGYRVQQILNSAADVYAINTYAPDGIYQEAGTGPGDLMYQDVNGDGEITVDDRVILGNPWPKMTYAFNINVIFNRSFDLALQFQGVQGVDVFNANKAYARNFYGDYNTTTDIFEAWTPENPTKNPRNIGSDPNGNFSRPSSYFIEDGSYLKLRNIQIGYNVPAEHLSPLRLGGLRLFVNANNILTFTKYSGLDPEIAGSNISRGIDYGMYPQVRTVSGGVEVKF